MMRWIFTLWLFSTSVNASSVYDWAHTATDTKISNSERNLAIQKLSTLVESGRSLWLWLSARSPHAAQLHPTKSNAASQRKVAWKKLTAHLFTSTASSIRRSQLLAGLQHQDPVVQQLSVEKLIKSENEVFELSTTMPSLEIEQDELVSIIDKIAVDSLSVQSTLLEFLQTKPSIAKRELVQKALSSLPTIR